jgi:hypothetical protein
MYKHGTNLINIHTVVLEEQEPILSNSSLDLLLKFGYNSRIIAIHKAQVDGRELSKVIDLLGNWWWDPVINVDLTRTIGWRRLKGSARCHNVK